MTTVNDVINQLVFDDAMVTAVKEFQQKQGLTPDGIVGPKTLFGLDVK
jgi:murein L,D-transpeptidase YcbB/YkuD